MSNAGLDNWRRDYHTKERALLILERLVEPIDKHGTSFDSFDSGFWEAFEEAKLLLAEERDR